MWIIKRVWFVFLPVVVVGLVACDGGFEDDAFVDDFDDPLSFEEDEFGEDEPFFDDGDEFDDEEGVAEDGEPELADRSYLDGFGAYVAEVVERDGIAGAAVAVIEKGEVVLVEGFGYRDVENGLPVTADTLFHIGSTNKSMTALMIATLVDEGVIGWDTPIVDVYPDFALSEEITFRHLLSMRSGIADEAEDDFDIDNGSAEDVLEYLYEIELAAEPGEAFSYSNLSSSVAGYTAVMAAEADGNGLYDGYASLLQQQVLGPIGMETAVVRVSDAQQNPNYGKSYWEGPEEAEPEDYDGDPLAPSGTVKASAAEMGLYIAMYLNDGVAPNGTRVVSAESMQVMFEPYLEDYALGWENKMVDGVQVISHEGSFDNYLSIIGFVPEEGVGFVILTNTAEAAEGLIDEGPSMLLDLYFGE